jgi:uroporphyrinogen decarboxylase
MTPRDRIKAVLNHRKPDVLPWLESMFDETIMAWFRQGLPTDKVIAIEWEMGRGGTNLYNWPAVKGFDAYSYFGCQSYYGCVVPLDVGPLPRFKQKIIREDDRYVTMRTETGAIAKRIKSEGRTWYSMPMFTEFPVKDQETWGQYKKLLNPKDPRRYPKDWHKDDYLSQFENYQQGITMMRFNGFYGFGAELMGIAPFNIALYKDPELIHDMAEHWEYYIRETVREAVETLKDRIDMVFWWEDMAEKHGPNMSPKLFRQYCLPHYKDLTGFLKKNKIDRIMVDSDGNINPMLDLLIESGITGLWPLEVNCNMNAIEIKKKYGNKLFLIGNLDKRELAKGGEAMRKEVDSKLPILKEMGGYIPGADHLIHVEFSLEKFKEYAGYIQKLLPYQ